MKLVVVISDQPLGDYTAGLLREAGHEVTACNASAEGIEAIRSVKPDLAIINSTLSDGTGLGVIGTLRAAGHGRPLLLLTDRRKPDDVVAGLDGGADDCLAVPFPVDELLARVRALGRRRPATLAGSRLRLGSLTLDLLRRRVDWEGNEIDLTSREFAILEYFLRRRGMVVERAALVEGVWEKSEKPASNIVDVYLNKLRAKLRDHGVPEFITTLKGVGYKIEEI